MTNQCTVQLLPIYNKQLRSRGLFADKHLVSRQPRSAQDNEMKALVGSTAGSFEGLVQLLNGDLYLKALDAGFTATLSVICNGP